VPGWLPTVIDLHDWAQRYGARIDSWRLHTSGAKRKQLAETYGSDALALLRAVYAPEAPHWLCELPAVEVLRQVLAQNYHIRIDTHGREVITRRETETQTVSRRAERISSPYDTDTVGPPRARTWSGTATRSTSAKPATPPTRDVHTAQHAARAAQDTKPWQATYALRAGVEGTLHHALAVCDTPPGPLP